MKLNFLPTEWKTVAYFNGGRVNTANVAAHITIIPDKNMIDEDTGRPREHTIAGPISIQNLSGTCLIRLVVYHEQTGNPLEFCTFPTKFPFSVAMKKVQGKSKAKVIKITVDTGDNKEEGWQELVLRINHDGNNDACSPPVLFYKTLDHASNLVKEAARYYAEEARKDAVKQIRKKQEDMKNHRDSRRESDISYMSIELLKSP